MYVSKYPVWEKGRFCEDNVFILLRRLAYHPVNRINCGLVTTRKCKLGIINSSMEPNPNLKISQNSYSVVGL